MGMYRTLFYAGLILAVAFLIASIVLFFVLKIPKALGVVTGRTQRRAIEEIRAGGYEARSKQEAIHSSGRKIHVREVEMDTGALHKGQSGTITREQPAPSTTAKMTSKDKETARPNRDRSKAYEQTEVLDFTGDLYSQGKAPESDSTEILGGGGSAGGNAGFSGEEATDVLGAGPVSGSSAAFTGEEATDVLGSSRGNAAEGERETDVLISGTSVPEDDEIVGRYSAEETAVLRSMHVMEEDKHVKRAGEIRVLYAETIVHTEEEL